MTVEAPLHALATVPESYLPNFSYGKVGAMNGAPDWRRLASYVVSARLAAGYKDRRALSAASGVTDRTLGKLENGQPVSPETLAAVEALVGWKPDSARRILHGGEPDTRTLEAFDAATAEAADPVKLLLPPDQYAALTPSMRERMREALEADARTYADMLRPPA